MSMPPPGTVELLEFNTNEVGEPVIIHLPVPTNDPNDPLNWPNWRKNLNFFFVFAFSAAVFTTLMIQSIFWQQMNEELGITYQHLNWSVAVQSVGLAMGCMLFVPFTKKYGRRSSYILSMSVLTASYWWTSRLQSTAELYITNLIQGLASALNETLAQITIADLYFVHQRGRANSWYMVAVVLGSYLLPVAGGAQAAYEGWRVSYYTCAACMTVLCIVSIFFFEETKYIPVVDGVEQSLQSNGIMPHHDNDLDKDIKIDDDASARASFDYKKDDISPVPPMKSYRERLAWTTKTEESLWELFKAPILTTALPAVAWTSLQYAAVVAWINVISSVMSEYFSAPPYNMSTMGVGAMAVPGFIGAVLGSFYCGLFGDWLITYLAKKNGGIYEPEMRLYPLALPLITMLPGAVMFGVCLERGKHWILPAVGIGLFSFGMGALGDATFTFCIDSYRELTGEAFVMISFWRNVVSIGIPFAIAPWEQMGVGNMHIVLGVIQFALTVTFIPMIYWGKKLRAKSGPYYYELVRRQVSPNKR